MFNNLRVLIETQSSKLFEILKLEFTVVNKNGEALTGSNFTISK